MALNKQIEEPELLSEFLKEYRVGPESFKVLVLRLVHELQDVSRVSSITGVPAPTLYEWIAEWNKKTASLRSRQGEGGGARGRLTAEQFEELCRKLRSEQRLWTTRELQEYLQERWGVRYSLRQVRRIARRCGLGYRKPYVLDERVRRMQNCN